MLFNNRKPDESVAHGGTTLIKTRSGPSCASPLTAQPRPMAGAPARCVIDAALVITGNLESERDVQLDGELRGDITCSQLVISRDATLLGNVVADEVVVRGKVKGIIRASQVMLQDTRASRARSSTSRWSWSKGRALTASRTARTTSRTQTPSSPSSRPWRQI